MRHLGHQQMTPDTALGMTKRVIVDQGGSFSPFFPLDVQAASVPCASEKARKAQTGHVDTILAFNSHLELPTMIKRRLKEERQTYITRGATVARLVLGR